MKRITIALIAVLTMLMCAGETLANGGPATKTATPETYKIIINKVRMWNGTDGQWYLASTGDTCFDITTAEVGCSCGCYCTGVDLPDGTYTKMEITMSRTFVIKAQVNDDADAFGAALLSPIDYYTTSTTTGTSIDCSRDIVQYAEGTVVIAAPAGWTSTDGYMYREYDLPASITITGGTPRTVRINFNITNAVTFSGLSGVVGCTPNTPVITITQVQ